jgi:hypothetical protein
LEGKIIKENRLKHCWEYYNCSEQSRKICPAYHQGKMDNNFKDCFFYIDNTYIGGPEKHGPCLDCDWRKSNNFVELKGYQ